MGLAGDGGKKIFKPELLNTLSNLSIKMDQDEFDKLWKK